MVDVPWIHSVDSFTVDTQCGSCTTDIHEGSCIVGLQSGLCRVDTQRGYARWIHSVVPVEWMSVLIMYR